MSEALLAEAVMVHPPIPPERRRHIAPPEPRRGLHNVDLAHRVGRLKAVTWGVAVGAIGSSAGTLASAIAGTFEALPYIVGGSLLAGMAVYLLTTFLADRAAGAAEVFYNPSGKSTPPKREYSYAESLIKRARYGEAATAYELYTTENPADPEPYLRLARLYRDHFHQYEDAVTWLRRARADAHLTSGQHLLVMQELIDLYLQRLKTPRKAMPELALMCERFPGTPQAEAAERELVEMREMLEREREEMIPFTQQFLQRMGHEPLGEAPRDATGESDTTSDGEV